MIMKVLAAIVLIWLFFAAVGTAFGILGKVIWLAILFSVIAAVWGFIQIK